MWWLRKGSRVIWIGLYFEFFYSEQGSTDQNRSNFKTWDRTRTNKNFQILERTRTNKILKILDRLAPVGPRTWRSVDSRFLLQIFLNYYLFFYKNWKVINRWCITISRCNWWARKFDCKLKCNQSKWEWRKCYFEFDFSTVHSFPSADSVRPQASFMNSS